MVDLHCIAQEAQSLKFAVDVLLVSSPLPAALCPRTALEFVSDTSPQTCRNGVRNELAREAPQPITSLDRTPQLATCQASIPDKWTCDLYVDNWTKKAPPQE